VAPPLPISRNREEDPQDLQDLRTQVESLPRTWREKLIPVCEKVCEYARLQGRLIKIAQDSVEQLQLDIKYLLFDLEATRRERDALREELENS
jgi:hypothetical protein